jgi:hypothetical protein
LTAHAAEKLLHGTILEGMKADHREHAAGGELRECGGQRPIDRANLVVHRDANALE